GRPITPELVQAERDAVAYFQKLVDEDRAAPGHRQRLAVSLTNLANSLQTRGQLREAEEPLRRAQTLYEALVAEAPAAPAYRYLLARNFSKLSTLMWYGGRLDDGLALGRQALALFE